MKKLAVLLAFLLVFAFAAAENDDSVIATFDGGEVRFDEIYGDYEGLAAVYAALYGEDAGERADVALELSRRLADEVIKEKLLAAYADSLGGDLLTEAQRAEIETLARRDYQLLYEESLPIYLAADDLTEDEAAQELANDLAAEGLDYESYLKTYTKNYEQTAALARLAGEVKVTTAEVNQLYAERLASDTEYFSAYPEDYPYAYFYTQQTVLYIPEGLRRVRLYYIDITQAGMEALIASDNTGKIMDYAQSAEPIFGALGGDEGAPICENCALFEDGILSAALSLEKPGDRSMPVNTVNGYIVVEYIGDIKSTTVPLKTVYTELYDAVYSEKQQKQGEAKLEEMFANANVQYYLYRLG